LNQIQLRSRIGDIGMALSTCRHWQFTLITGSGLLLVAGIVLVWYVCSADSPTAQPVFRGPPGRADGLKPPQVRFTDITAASGIRFTHTNGSFGKKLLPETMGSGVAFIDFDNDGHQDLLFVNSCCWPGYEDPSQPAPTLALYRNQGDGTFVDVTAACGLDVTLFGMGVTVGDFDNDGWPDIFITAMGGYRLFHNERHRRGGRRFVDVTASAGDLAKGGAGLPTADFLNSAETIAWPNSAAFVDYNNDGLLDLFVCCYVTWSPKFDLAHDCSITKERAFCPPRVFPGTHCVLYKNLGGGKFEDVSVKAGIPVNNDRGKPLGKALGVIVCDVDDDGWPDIIVANDTERNFFFHNQRDGTFKECAEQVGLAYADGAPRSGMGIDWAEYRPHHYAVAVGNYALEPITLQRRVGLQPLLFADVALTEGLYGSNTSVIFGLFFFDYDLDGQQDLLTCNGHTEPGIKLARPHETYQQAVQLFWNSGGQPTFEPVTAEFAGPDLFRPMIGRGSAFADIDGDGYLDVVLTANGGPARLLKNQGGTGNHWVRLVLEGDGKRCNRSAIGAKVTLTAGGKVQHLVVTSGRGYFSQSELPLTFGLGKAATVDRVEIHWPGAPPGDVQVLDPPPAMDRVHRIKQK
jgi:hypothetical protein